MKTVKMFVIAVIFWVFQEETAKAIIEIPLFQSFNVKTVIRLPYNRASMKLVSKLMGTAGYENVVFVLVFSHGTAMKFEYGKRVILMAVKNPNPIITATISAPDAAEGKAKLAESIRDKGASTEYVTIPPTQLSDLTPLIANLRAAVGVAQVDYAWGELNAALKLIMRIIQDTMDANKPQSVIICIHYGFHPQGRGGRTAQIYHGESGALAGTIDLVFPVGPQNCCYDIRLYSADRTTFARALPSDIAHATVGGLVSGFMQNVSVTQVIHGVEQEESQIIAVRVK